MRFRAGDSLLDNAPWLGRTVEVDSNQIETLIKQSTFYHVGDSRHAQNIQINKVIGEHEKRVLFYGKNRTDFLANPIYFAPTIV